MAGYPSMPLFVKDYLIDTTALTLEQSGAYLHLLMHAWSRGGELPDDDRQLAAFAKCSMHKWRAIRRVLEGYFVVDNGVWINERLAKELRFVKDLSRKRSLAGSRAFKAKAAKINDLPEHLLNDCISNRQAPTPTPTLSIPLDKSNGSPEPPDDPKRHFWRAAKSYLAGCGVRPDRTGAIIGKWVRDHGDEAVAAAVSAAQIEGVVEPVAWITARLQRSRMVRPETAADRAPVV